MPKNLVIVESATKAKTIEKILGQDFKVVSCVGHISDLPVKELGVDVDNDFTPKYIIPTEKKPVIKDLKRYVSESDKIWLASDEDREGEAIAWHLYENLDLTNKDYDRIVFHEITKNAILSALDSPREINYNLVNAQQARRVLDRLVGYELSPVLWRKVKTGLSAGRVQSVSVRLIVEKEREIKSFTTNSSYKPVGTFKNSSGVNLKAEFNTKFNSAEEVKAFLQKNINSTYTVSDVEKKPAKKSPTPQGREEETVLRLSRVGFDNILGYLKGGIETWVSSGKDTQQIKNINSKDFLKLNSESSIEVLDVRSKKENSQSKVENSFNIPLISLKDEIKEININNNLYVYCKGGYRSMIACSILKSNKKHNIVNILGGFDSISSNLSI